MLDPGIHSNVDQIQEVLLGVARTDGSSVPPLS